MFYHEGVKISKFLCKSPTISSAKQLCIRFLPCCNNFSIQSSVWNETRQRVQSSKRKFKLSAVPELGNSRQEMLFHSSSPCSTGDSSSTSDNTHRPKVSTFLFTR